MREALLFCVQGAWLPRRPSLAPARPLDHDPARRMSSNACPRSPLPKQQAIHFFFTNASLGFRSQRSLAYLQRTTQGCSRALSRRPA